MKVAEVNYVIHVVIHVIHTKKLDKHDLVYLVWM